MVSPKTDLSVNSESKGFIFKQILYRLFLQCIPGSFFFFFFAFKKNINLKKFFSLLQLTFQEFRNLPVKLVFRQNKSLICYRHTACFACCISSQPHTTSWSPTSEKSLATPLLKDISTALGKKIEFSANLLLFHICRKIYPAYTWSQFPDLSIFKRVMFIIKYIDAMAFRRARIMLLPLCPTSDCTAIHYMNNLIL